MFNTPEDQQQWLDETIAKINVQVSRRTPPNVFPTVFTIKEAYHNAFENPLSEEYAHLIRDEYIRLAREKVNLMVETELIIEPKPDLVVDMTPDRIIAEPKETTPTSGPFVRLLNDNSRLVGENAELRIKNASLRSNLTEAEGKLSAFEASDGVGHEAGLVAALHEEQAEAMNLPHHANDGNAHLAYFDNETQASFVWDGDVVGYVQIGFGGYGEPITAGFSFSRFDEIGQRLLGDTPDSDSDTIRMADGFERACKTWLALTNP